MSLLVFNAGSSSLKFALFDAAAEATLASGLVDWVGDRQHADFVVQGTGADKVQLQVPVTDYGAGVNQIVHFLTERKTITAVGHRVVHGGTLFRDSVRIDSSVKSAIARLAELAPLHNPPALETIEAAKAILPDLPQVAAFDTAYYADLPPRAYIYPVPYEWYSEWGLRRFGFHGISHAYCAGRAAELLSRNLAGLRLVNCHLGNGCSATAIQNGRAVATTMGFTPMDGLMMGTRSGSLDPGIPLYVQKHHALTNEQLDQALNHACGLLGVSGLSSDCRQVEEAARQGHERARLALEIYADRVRAAIGALAAGMGGVDALSFTAGVGENAASLREEICRGLECLGLQLDRSKNNACHPDSDITTAESRGRILVIHTREELNIAQEVRRLC